MVKRWLSENKISYDKIFFTKSDKLQYCIDNKIDLMIDDAPKNIKKISTVLPVICFDATYNRECIGDKIIRCYSWYDIYTKIKEYKIKFP